MSLTSCCVSNGCHHVTTYFRLFRKLHIYHYQWAYSVAQQHVKQQDDSLLSQIVEMLLLSIYIPPRHTKKLNWSVWMGEKCRGWPIELAMWFQATYVRWHYGVNTDTYHDKNVWSSVTQHIPLLLLCLPPNCFQYFWLCFITSELFQSGRHLSVIMVTRHVTVDGNWLCKTHW